jgi:hypothetical protein
MKNADLSRETLVFRNAHLGAHWMTLEMESVIWLVIVKNVILMEMTVFVHLGVLILNLEHPAKDFLTLVTVKIVGLRMENVEIALLDVLII